MRKLQVLCTGMLWLFSISLTQAAELSAEQEWQIKAAIKELSDAYGINRDNNDFDGYANTFAEDGELTLYGNTAKGREAIRARAADSNDNVRMHVMTTSAIQVIDSENATGVHYVTVFSAAKGEGHEQGDVVIAPDYRVMGKYHDEYVLTEDGWKFSRRELEPIFRASE